MKLAICLATRGKVHSRTIESVLKNLGNYSWEMFLTHDLPIPEAQNNLVKRAMEWGANWLWFVEEDMLIPYETLGRMLELQLDYVAVDYPVGEKRASCIARKNGEILWTGLGCTLMHRRVFEKIEEPWFETHRSVRITSQDPYEYVIDDNIPFKYGGHDIMLGIKAREKGVELTQLDGVTAGHIKPVATGQEGSNSGTYKFEIWNEIKEFQNYNKVSRKD